MAKLDRKTQKLFAGTSGGIGQFGSAQLATPTLSDDLDVLQNLPAYNGGWVDAVISGDKRPPLEEFNGLKYINDYQNSYIFQEGIAEYDTGTTYYTNSLVKESGTTNIYKSLIDDNIGNALTSIADWELLGDLRQATGEILVRSEADFPTPSAGVITFNSTHDGNSYTLTNPLSIDNRFVIEDGINIKFTATSLDKTLTYTGVGIMFESSNYGIFEHDSLVMNCSTGTMFGLSGAGVFLSRNCSYNSASAGGTISGTLANIAGVNFSDFGQGVILSNIPSINISNVNFSLFRNEVAIMLEFTGTISGITLNDLIFTPNSNESAINFDPSIADSDGRITFIGGDFRLNLGGQIFETDSLDQKYLNAKFTGNLGIPDSTVSLQAALRNGTDITTINTVSVRELINARWSGQLPERLVFQDFVTFDNATNTLTSRLTDGTTAYNHDLTNGDIVALKEGIAPAAGTLPPELSEDIRYFIVNLTATTFQLSLTAGGGAISFSTDGTGTNYFRHTTGTNAATWIVYLGVESEKISCSGSVTLLVETGTTKRLVFAEIAKLDTSFNIVDLGLNNLFGKGGVVEVDNNTKQSSPIHTLIELSDEESVRFFVTNDSNDINILVTDATIELLKN